MTEQIQRALNIAPANRVEMPKADVSKWVTPLAIADLIAFLLSDEAADITGALIPITGRT